MKHMGKATVGILVFWLWAYITGPMGLVVGGIAFLGGFALGHRSGYRDAFDRMRSSFTIPTPGPGIGYYTNVTDIHGRRD